MKREAAALGFAYDTAKSHKNFPVFSMPLADEWDLCWAIEDARTFLWNPEEEL
jgi:hypothetical protein